MAPKTIEASKKRKGKESATGSYDSQRFCSKLHEEHFYDVTYKRIVILEVKFALQPDEYPEIQFQIQRSPSRMSLGSMKRTIRASLEEKSLTSAHEISNRPSDCHLLIIWMKNAIAKR
ncbi:hypothetical protein AHAS_Ahas17G0188300 [Arachis hypogaea]